MPEPGGKKLPLQGFSVLNWHEPSVMLNFAVWVDSPGIAMCFNILWPLTFNTFIHDAISTPAHPIFAGLPRRGADRLCNARVPLGTIRMSAAGFGAVPGGSGALPGHHASGDPSPHRTKPLHHHPAGAGGTHHLHPRHAPRIHPLSANDDDRRQRGRTRCVDQKLRQPVVSATLRQPGLQTPRATLTPDRSMGRIRIDRSA